MREEAQPDVDATVFASTDPPRLAGTRCHDCSAVVFPRTRSCPQCSSEVVSEVVLPDRGVIWTHTVQGFLPRAPYEAPPEGFEPFAVAYVDLGDVLVESPILGAIDEVRIGAPCQMTLVQPANPGGPLRFAFTIEDAT